MKKIFTKQCPSCEKTQTYTHPVSFKKALKENSICLNCRSKKRASDPKERNRLKKIASQPGEKNPFYGKTHSPQTLEKIKHTQFKKGSATMSGKSVYSIWLKKHGKEEADKKMAAFKKKQSENSSGKNNPMYGKPSPKGSGNGWSGWYKGWYFRSLRELSYMINVIERFGFSWESGEKKKWKIRYVNWEGRERNYFPDFIIEGKYMVECKPKNLWSSSDVISKSDAAKKFCEINDLIYKLRSPRKISEKEIKNLYLQGLIKWTERYQKKYEEKYRKP